MQPKKMAPTKVLAELNFLEFHQQKGQLECGTYRVVEHDGEINYAVLGQCRGTLVFDIDWYTEDEYISYGEDDARLNAIMDFDPDLDEELMDSWDRAMHRETDNRLADEIAMADHDEFRRVSAEDFANDDDRVDDEHLIVEMSRPGKTLGELLREHLDNKPEVTTNTPMFNERPYIEAADLAEAEFEDMTEPEFDMHRHDLSSFMERSHEQLNIAMAALPPEAIKSGE
jgi:hypothetical protein